jgi:hypothetical protein
MALNQDSMDNEVWVPGQLLVRKQCVTCQHSAGTLPSRLCHDAVCN